MRIYDAASLKCATLPSDGQPPEASLLPPTAAARAQWGWRQDEDGDWFREIPDAPAGQS